MARDFKTSRFRGGASVGEDVNPSAYIVNLADCMLVLACGFLVALISFYNIDVVPVTELDEEAMEQVEPDTLPEELLEGGGSYYVEAGTVYRDPNTGVLYMVETASGASDEDAGEGASPGTAQTGASASGQSADAARIAESRANGAD